MFDEATLGMISAVMGAFFFFNLLSGSSRTGSKASAFLYASCMVMTASAAIIPRRQMANVMTACTVPKTAALTFDDGPFSWHNQIVDTLDAAGAKGTFFINGNNYGCIYSNDSVNRMQYSYSRGHQIASHTWDHAHLPTLDETRMEQQFNLSDVAFSKILGVVPTFMRPPYGEYNDLVQKVAADHNQNVIIWDVDSEDSMGATAEQSEQTYTNAVERGAASILTLNHETHESTAVEVLPFMIKLFKDKGYKLVTVAECLGYKPQDMYQRRTKPGVRDDSWTCVGTPLPGQ
ncbi:carbohydrate esterase family 4 protein [Botryobasidium botryosum FD-172 SS1]|uniref:Carbohydrate esterase family 4 protein n=1 Tax=Botryobasidium botryosum (strain FD-172 SS1) TaxID=930990 RepID=A0A067LXB4_BOTB1|nr:carbohydrate esterase family 4 protein [Botryobasidium botryosum FD-172 SS1]